MVPALLAAVLVYTLLHRDFGREHRPRRNGGHGRVLAAAGAGAIGLYDGFFGPGTGSFLMFLFVRVFGMDFLHASASAKVVNAAANLAAILLFGLTGEVFWLLGLAMAVCNVAGAHAGNPPRDTSRQRVRAHRLHPGGRLPDRKDCLGRVRDLIPICAPWPDAAGSSPIAG